MRRIGIDLRIVRYARSGFHRYAEGLIESLRRFPPPDTRFWLLRHRDDARRERLAPHLEEGVLETPLFSVHEADQLRCEIAARALDVFHFPFALFPGRVAPRVLLTIHDLTCLRFPEFQEERYRPHYEAAIRRAGEADEIVVVSDAVAREVREAGAPPERIRVCHPLTPFEHAARGEDADVELLERVGDRPFLLCVGSLEPRKNHAAALAAFEIFRRRTPEASRLLIVGGHGWLSEDLFAAHAAHPFRDDVWILRDVNDGTLTALLARCRIFLALSRYEGFGLPVLEALAADACVLSTPVPSLVEAGFPREGLLASAEPETVAERLIPLFGDADGRRALAARTRDVVERAYRAEPRDRLVRAYAPPARGDRSLTVAPSRPIDVAGRSLLVYQVHYDDRTAARGDPRFTPVRNHRLGPFFESGVIAELLADGHHRRADLFAVFSWKFADKIPLRTNELVARIARDDAASDVYSFFGAVADDRLWVVAERKHPGILDAAALLMERLGLDVDLAALSAPIVYQNHFVARSSCYERFGEEMLRPALEKMSDRADPELAALLERDAGYGDVRLAPERTKALFGKPHLCLHPFVAERLFATWLALHPEIRVRQIWRGRFVEKSNRAHEPELRRRGAGR